MKATNEGLQRGHMIYGPMGSSNHLFTITRVLGPHSVEAITHLGDSLATITLRTHRFHNPESEWKQVYLVTGDRLPAPDDRIGALRIRRGY